MSDEERKVFRALRRSIRGKLILRTPDGKEVEAGEIILVRRGYGTKPGRPDFVIWVDLNLNVLGLKTGVKIPIAVEAEKAGIQAAREDFKTLFEEEGIELPAIVVGGTKRQRKDQKYKAKLKLKVTQLPLGRIRPDP